MCRGVRTKELGEGVNEIDTVMAISDLIKLGKMRVLSSKSQVVDPEQMKQQIGHEHLLPPFLRKVSEVEGLLASPSARYIEAVFFAINDWRRATTTFDKVLCWSRFIAHVRGTTVLSVY